MPPRAHAIHAAPRQSALRSPTHRTPGSPAINRIDHVFHAGRSRVVAGPPRHRADATGRRALSARLPIPDERREPLPGSPRPLKSARSVPRDAHADRAKAVTPPTRRSPGGAEHTAREDADVGRYRRGVFRAGDEIAVEPIDEYGQNFGLFRGSERVGAVLCSVACGASSWSSAHGAGRFADLRGAGASPHSMSETESWHRTPSGGYCRAV